MVQAGKYVAKVKEHAITETKSGNMQVEITFEIQDESPHGLHGQTIRAWMSLSDKAAPYTIKNLVTMGLKGDDITGPLDKEKPVEIVVQDEAGLDGKMRAKVRFVNPLGQVRNAVPADLAKAKLAGLKGLVAKIRHDVGSSDDPDFGF